MFSIEVRTRASPVSEASVRSTVPNKAWPPAPRSSCSGRTAPLPHRGWAASRPSRRHRPPAGPSRDAGSCPSNTGWRDEVLAGRVPCRSGAFCRSLAERAEGGPDGLRDTGRGYVAGQEQGGVALGHGRSGTWNGEGVSVGRGAARRRRVRLGGRGPAIGCARGPRHRAHGRPSPCAPRGWRPTGRSRRCPAPRNACPG